MHGTGKLFRTRNVTLTTTAAVTFLPRLCRGRGTAPRSARSAAGGWWRGHFLRVGRPPPPLPRLRGDGTSPGKPGEESDRRDQEYQTKNPAARRAPGAEPQRAEISRAFDQTRQAENARNRQIISYTERFARCRQRNGVPGPMFTGAQGRLVCRISWPARRGVTEAARLRAGPSRGGRRSWHPEQDQPGQFRY
jgi:hypothetical protein